MKKKIRELTFEDLGKKAVCEEANGALVTGILNSIEFTVYEGGGSQAAIRIDEVSLKFPDDELHYTVTVEESK